MIGPLLEIARERRRQKAVEGWSDAHDDHHDEGVLARAAGCYALHAGADVHSYRNGGAPPEWPWAPEWWKPRGPRRNLIRAAALILAELERLDRADYNNENSCPYGGHAQDGSRCPYCNYSNPLAPYAWGFVLGGGVMVVYAVFKLLSSL